MTTLLWVLLGVVLAWALARINQSNKLFWILFTSFMVGIAGAALMNKVVSAQSENEIIQTCITQSSEVTSDSCPVTGDLLMTPSSLVPNSVGKTQSDVKDFNFTTCKGHVLLRTQPPINHRLCIKNSTTHHD